MLENHVREPDKEDQIRKAKEVADQLNNKPTDRFKDIEMKTYNKLPKYIQDATIAVDSYDPRSYGYKEPINYHIYYVDKDGKVNFYSGDGADFISNMRYWGKDAFGKVDDFEYNGKFSEGDILKRKQLNESVKPEYDSNFKYWFDNADGDIASALQDILYDRVADTWEQGGKEYDIHWSGGRFVKIVKQATPEDPYLEFIADVIVSPAGKEGPLKQITLKDPISKKPKRFKVQMYKKQSED